MNISCNNCEEIVGIRLYDIPEEWREPIVYSICRLLESTPKHCELDFSNYLDKLTFNWRTELTELICKAFTLECEIDCQKCKKVLKNYLPSFPKSWKMEIINIICDILQSKKCLPIECVTYLITPFSGIGATIFPYSYKDCDNNTQTSTIKKDDNIIICAIKDSIIIDNRFNIVQIYNNCNMDTPDCYCLTLTNIETEIGIIQYKYSYKDCNGGIFTDIPLSLGTSITICANPISLETNFAHSISGSTPCTDVCS